jgi:hypothetical protein
MDLANRSIRALGEARSRFPREAGEEGYSGATPLMLLPF